MSVGATRVSYPNDERSSTSDARATVRLPATRRRSIFSASGLPAGAVYATSFRSAPGTVRMSQSSVTFPTCGRVAFPTYGAYAAAKFALEGFSDALRREVGRLGVKVIVVEPGTIATPMWGKGIATMDELAATMTADQHARYDDLIAAMHKQAEGQAGSGIPLLRAATVIVAAIQARKPRARYLVGRDATLLAGLAGLLSDHVLDRLVARTLGV